MIRKLLSLAIFSLVLSTMPLQASTLESMERIDNVGQQASVVSVANGVVRVAGANGQTLQIYNLAGVCVYSAKVDGADRSFDVNLPKGCYIIKVGKVVRKVSIR